MNQSFHDEQVNKLKQRLTEIEEKINIKGVSDFEYSKLKDEYDDINEQLENARSMNKEIVYLQDIILSMDSYINLINSELSKYEDLEKIGIKFVEENAKWNPVTVLQNNKKQAQECIVKCRARIKELKS